MNTTKPQQSHTYTHAKQESLMSRILKLGLRLMGAKTALAKVLDKGEPIDPEPMPKSFPQKYRVETDTFGGRELWTLGPKSGKSDKMIFYVPGGAYVFSIVGLHWTLISKLIDATNATVVVANYPKIPEATAEGTYTYMETLYQKAAATHADKEIIIMGDSAGGGLAIGFAQDIKDKSLAQPSQVIALSPWLDVTMRNPDIPAIEKDDKALNPISLRKAGEIYAGEMDTQDPRVSPIFGDFQGLPQLSIFTGTHEIFDADTRKLKKRLDQEGIAFNYYEYPRMIHTWMLMPVGETKQAIAQIVDLVEGR